MGVIREGADAHREADGEREGQRGLAGRSGRLTLAWT